MIQKVDCEKELKNTGQWLTEDRGKGGWFQNVFADEKDPVLVR